MHAYRSSKKSVRKGRSVGFPRCKSTDRSKPSDTFTESTRHLAKKVAAGEASVQKDTILHIGGRWPASVLIRYLIRYLEWYLIRYQVRPVIQ